MVQEGQRLYGGVCFACHGENGVGTPIGPALNDQQWIHITGEFQEIVNITTTGVAQPRQYPAPMPPRGGGPFTDDQIRAIGAYVYTLSHGG
jgi:mono/diheme cytochrome c family protein